MPIKRSFSTRTYGPRPGRDGIDAASSPSPPSSSSDDDSGDECEHPPHRYASSRDVQPLPSKRCTLPARTPLAVGHSWPQTTMTWYGWPSLSGNVGRRSSSSSPRPGSGTVIVLPRELRLLCRRLRGRCSSGKCDRSPRNSLRSPAGVGSESCMLNVTRRSLRFGRMLATGSTGSIGAGSAVRGV